MNFAPMLHSLRKAPGVRVVAAAGDFPFRTVAEARSALERRDSVGAPIHVCPVLHQLSHWILVYRDRWGTVGVFDSSPYQHNELNFCGLFCLFAVAALLFGYSADALHALLNGAQKGGGGGVLDSLVLDSVIDLFQLADDNDGR